MNSFDAKLMHAIVNARYEIVQVYVQRKVRLLK